MMGHTVYDIPRSGYTSPWDMTASQLVEAALGSRDSRLQDLGHALRWALDNGEYSRHTENQIRQYIEETTR